MIEQLLRYKNWADEVTFSSLMCLPSDELVKPRKTNFGNIVRTLNHVYVVDDIFRHHLTGRKHSYISRNTEVTPQLNTLYKKQLEMNAWLLAHLEELSDHEMGEPVQFQFIGGAQGEMKRGMIFLHLVNHATYHRGFVNDMMYQIPARPPANDLPVFLRGAQQGSF
jgi:uncharacterized damage-inducible protein DinB